MRGLVITSPSGASPAPSVSGGDCAGLCVSANGNLAAIARTSSSNFSATMPKDGGERWELLVATYNNAGAAGAHAIALHRPRTSSKATTSTATLPANVNTSQVCRILGSASALSGAVEGALFAYWPGRVLTDAAIAAIYASAKSSLAVSGIEI